VSNVKIMVGDCLERLGELPAESVHCCVTSPPYLGLRRYMPDGHPDKDKEIGSEATPEEFIAVMVDLFRKMRRVMRADGVVWINLGDSYAHGKTGRTDHGSSSTTSTLGPSHNGISGGTPPGPVSVRKPPPGFKPLDLLGIPWRAVLALQADGWYLRQAVVWHKKNPMPESINGTRWERHRTRVAPAARGGQPSKVQSKGKPQRDTVPGGDFAQGTIWEDCPGCPKCEANDGLVLRRGAWRPTTDHEYIFQLVKSPQYFCDAEAVKEPTTGGAHGRGNGVNPKAAQNAHGARQNASFSGAVSQVVATRNKRSVWTTTSKPLREAHFAPFPEDIPRICIEASTSRKGCCPECGAQVARVVERASPTEPIESNGKWSTEDKQSSGRRILANIKAARAAGGDHDNPFPPVKTIGWRPTCDCNAGDPVPCTILDPFFGAGTTGLVAMKMGRDCVGIELNQDYAEIARKRIADQAGLFGKVEVLPSPLKITPTDPAATPKD